MKIRYLAGLLLVGLALVSCTNPVTTAVTTYQLIVGSTATQGQAAALHYGIAALQKTTNGYIETCVQPANNGMPGCDKSTVGKVAKALQASRAADDSLVAALVTAQKMGTNVGVASTIYNAAAGAASTLSAAKPS